jgi:hypothetical protein
VNEIDMIRAIGLIAHHDLSVLVVQRDRAIRELVPSPAASANLVSPESRTP